MHTFSQCSYQDHVPRSRPDHHHRHHHRPARKKDTLLVPRQDSRQSSPEYEGLSCTAIPEEAHLLTYKSAALNHINSNHVNHRILRAPSPSTSAGKSSTKGLSSDAHPNRWPLRAGDDAHRSSVPLAEPAEPMPPANMALIPGGTASTLAVHKKSRRQSLLGSLRSSFRVKSPSRLTGREVALQRRRQQSQPHDCKACGCERIRINVSGQYFETRVGLLNEHPDTLLGNPKKRQKFYDRTRDEFFIDRHRPSFEAIFAYFQYGGKLKRPHTVPDDIFLAECVFYEIENDVLEEYKTSEGYVHEEVKLPKNETLKKLWMLFEYPETSNWAFGIAVISVIMTLVSIVLFCVETLPIFALTHCVENVAPNFLDPFFIIETVCTAWFTIEVIVRFMSCPSKLGFWKDFKNIVDVTAIIPYYVTFFNVISTMSCASAKSSASLAFLRVIRLIRIFKLTKHSVGLQVLILTFKASVEGLGLFLVALTVCLLVFSSAIYYAELGIEGSQIHSIPDAFWWAIITMTTVGYGDKYPVGPWGKLIGSICALVGVLTLAIPVPIITGNFNRFYSHKTGRGRNI
ncbi:hypothetical protein LSH36_959g00017 [Paralvinella palmiformis]|uniref:BTB domain-containing protein n=1 Tax=Paralvinella palmiformis TaxID=53620 RepID=A0AAD9IXN1_9ANNE|nr:hypothetical protein LSH36_959g00017 [Paralvinella palmiformis]